jgi:hypothetical protein
MLAWPDGSPAVLPGGDALSESAVAIAIAFAALRAVVPSAFAAIKAFTAAGSGLSAGQTAAMLAETRL